MDQSQLQQQQQQEAAVMAAAAAAVVPDGAPEPETAADAPVVSYNDLFPALPDSGLEAGGTTPGQTNPWAQRMRVGTSNVTQVQWQLEVRALEVLSLSPVENVCHSPCQEWGSGILWVWIVPSMFVYEMFSCFEALS